MAYAPQLALNGLNAACAQVQAYVSILAAAWHELRAHTFQLKTGAVAHAADRQHSPAEQPSRTDALPEPERTTSPTSPASSRQATPPMKLCDFSLDRLRGNVDNSGDDDDVGHDDCATCHAEAWQA